MSELARAYVELAHAINHHDPHFVDGYFGPEEWKPKERRSLTELAEDAATLMREVRALDDSPRRTFLESQVRAMATAVALLRGETLPFHEEVKQLYDVEVAYTPETRFDQAISLLDDLLPGQGDVAAREHAFRAAFEVPRERVEGVVEAIRAELRSRTRARFPLPEGEDVEVQFVNDYPWSAYNWYLGGYRSRIDINLDLPLRLHDLPNLVAHEAYPGHHTELAVKEQHLYREEGYAEHSVLLLYAPEAVVREGIAMHALRMVMSDEELGNWLERDLLERAGLGAADVKRMLEVSRVKEVLYRVRGNAALLLHVEGASEDDFFAYLQRYGLAKPEEARKALQSLTQPLGRGYVFTYLVGEALLDDLFSRGDAEEGFRRLLAEAASPGMVRTWIEQAQKA